MVQVVETTEAHDEAPSPGRSSWPWFPVVVWAALGVSSWLIAENVSARGEHRAWVGRLFALWSLVVFGLPLLGLLGGHLASERPTQTI